jgi:hypothetical protein
VGGYARVTGTPVGSDDTDRKTATATCTGGRVAVGGGYHVDTAVAGEDQHLSVVQNEATSDDEWTVTVVEDGLPAGSNWTLQAAAQCVLATP